MHSTRAFVMEETLTEQETAVYDRQIRIWGVEAQRRLSKARVLVVGVTGVTAEVCKNLVLAGIGSLGIMDDHIASFDSNSSTFLVCKDDVQDAKRSVADVCANSVREFNPMVNVTSVQGNIEDDERFLDDYDALILNRPSSSFKRRVNELCRKRERRIAFYTVSCIGSRGEIFVDLRNHTYTFKTAAGSDTAQLTKSFPSVADVLSVKWTSLPKRTAKLFFAMRVFEEFVEENGTSDDISKLLAIRASICDKEGVAAEATVPEVILKGLVESKGREFPPVSAIVGGILGQEIVKAMSCKGDPLRSLFYFDMGDGKGVIEDIIPLK